MFKGRVLELGGVVSTVQQIGQHVIVYGERGVGKTSLANMAREVFRASTTQVGLDIRIACTNDDNFESVWKKLTARLLLAIEDRPEETKVNLKSTVDRYEDILDMSGSVNPDTVARGLSVLSAAVPLIVVVDEFDRLGAWDDTVMFSDLIKMLSDDLIPCTVMIVGVADNVAGLLAGHASIDRTLRQVYMPRMSNAELTEIVTSGFERFAELSGVKITLDPKVIQAIVGLSQGFPYYTHLLANSLGQLAIRDHKRQINELDVFASLIVAMDEAAHSIKVAYTDAITSTKPSQFDLTLLACALTKTDDLGFFAPADVREPLSSISARTRTTPTFISHLKRFCDAPSYILDTRGEGRKTRYRFRDPLMKPFVLIKGIQSGNISLPGQNQDQFDDKHSVESDLNG